MLPNQQAKAACEMGNTKNARAFSKEHAVLQTEDCKPLRRNFLEQMQRLRSKIV
jgi:hypothetical protein